MKMRHVLLPATHTACLRGLGWPAAAQTVPAGTPTPAASVNPAGATAATPAPAAPATWWSTVTLGAQLEAGLTGNPDRPADGLNFGRLFDDKANTVLLNQVQ